jgi:hypothetical protein
MSSEPIRGRVARVLNTRELAINRGSVHGVSEGMRFAVLDTTAEGIEDPETGEELGSVYRTKVRVEVVIVKERLAIARTYATKQVNVGGTGFGGFGDAFKPPKWVSRHETLKADEAAWQELSEERSLVKTGDPVEEIVPERDNDETDSRATDVGEDLTAT